MSRVVEGFRSAGGDEVADIAGRFYRGDSSVTPEEWAPRFRLFGPG